MRQVLTKEEAQKILAPYFDKISGSIQKGFTDYLEMVGFDCYSKRRILDFNPRTKAALINNLIAVRVAESFSGKKGFTAKEYNGVFGLNLKSQFLIRFKKFNQNLSPARSRTHQTRKIENQQTVIPGFPRKPTFLYAGYTFTKDMTGIASIYLALRVNGRREWIMDITKQEQDQKVIPFSSVKGKSKKARVTVKPTVKKRKAS